MYELCMGGGIDGTSHISVVIVKFKEVRREHVSGCQLLDNSKRVLAQPSKANGYRGEQEELLVLRDPGSDVGVGGWESVGHNEDGHRAYCV